MYRTVADAGYTITLGAFGSVGVGGGFAMGGGHGMLIDHCIKTSWSPIFKQVLLVLNMGSQSITSYNTESSPPTAQS